MIDNVIGDIKHFRENTDHELKNSLQSDKDKRKGSELESNLSSGDFGY